jgi:molybdate transport system permease protein
MDWFPFFLSLRVATVATVIVTLVGVPLSLLMARGRFVGKSVLQTVLMLPMVLPPTVVGYYLLFLLGRHGPLARWLGVNLIFSWMAAVIASAVVALPLMILPTKAAIESVPPLLERAARTLGSPEWEVLWRITLPLARRGVLAGMVLSFARALGEFGATLMVAGNIPGKTQTLPLAIYDAVQLGRLRSAHLSVLLMTFLSFAAMWIVNRLQAHRPPGS